MADDIIPLRHSYALSMVERISELEAEVERLRAALDECELLRERMADILNRTANALHGGPLENGLWSWHDLPLLAQEARRG